MTKAIRWGLSALMTAGAIGLGSVAGCSDDEPDPVPVDPDTGSVTETGTIDTGILDTGTATETSTDSGDSGDTGIIFKADRAVSIVFASPDLTGKYLCAGAFAPGDLKAATSSPAQTLGPPGGVPDPAAPTDPTKFTPIPYGAVTPVALTKAAQDVLDTPLSIVLYLVDGKDKDCKAAWPDVRAKDSQWFAIKGSTAAGADATNSVKKGESALIRIAGCMGGATATGECGSAALPAPFKIDMIKLDTTTPATYGGGTSGPKVGLQFVHMSPFAGNAAPPVPPFQAIDVYFQGMSAPSKGGDAGPDADADPDATVPSMPVGTPVKIATAVKFGDKAPSSVGVQVAGDPTSAIVLLTPTGVPPCTPGSTGCATIPIPVGRFAAFYGSLPYGGGFKDGTNQFVGLVGSPLKMSPAAGSILMPFGLANVPK